MVSTLRLQNVSKAFGSLRAVDDFTADVETGTITILIGPNGSGKTTLINVVSGYYKPDSGRVLYNERDISGQPPHKVYKLGIARTFQIPNLFWKLTVLENVMVAKQNHPGEGFSRFAFKRLWINAERDTAKESFRILKTVGLYESWDKPAESLSGGQMKLLEIARALMSGAKLILLDEPISGVNPTLAHDIFGKLVSLKKERGITFFIIEHRLDIALRYVDSIVAMAYGKLIAMGKPEAVMSDSRLIEAYLGA
jgi:branched-chain amino acid transport system ATP-binding protein